MNTQRSNLIPPPIEKTMTLTTTVLYPNSLGKTFDVKYYLDSHMPLAEQLWGPLGMTSWVVIQFEPGPDGAAPPYRLKTVSEWESREKLSMAVASKEGKILRNDFAKFTDEVPIVLVGEEVVRSQKS
ncbi:hypothetical protein SLS57_004054 [Botryosphaeria dothidea]